VTRRNRLILWIAGIVTFLGLTYISVPWILAGWIKTGLSERGLGNIQVHVGYPGWHGLSVSRVNFSTTVGGYDVSGEFTDIDVEYRVAGLLTGNLASIHVPGGVVTARPATVHVSSATIPSAQPMVALVSGQWLSRLPARELVFDQLIVNLQSPADAVYTIKLSGAMDEAEAKINGEITLPEPQKNQPALSFTAARTGEVHLSLFPSTIATGPMLEWDVNTIAVNHARIEADGQLHAQLHALATFLRPWFNGANWMSAMEGDINSDWKAIVPDTGQEQATVMLDLRGKGSSWDFGGKVKVHGAEGQREPKLSVEILELGGRYKKTAMAGLNANAVLAIDNGVYTTKDAQARIDLLHIGFPVKNIEARFQLAQHGWKPIVRIKKLTAELLGGRARSDPFQLDPGKDKHRFVVQLEGIGLNDILQLEQQQDLRGSGKLDGRIPIEITHEGIHVAQGKLSARAPGGGINYLPTARVLALAKTNASVKMIVDALGNFQYHKMDVTSDYKPSGDLVLKVRLEGHNPDWQAGQPVNLNLNVEENIPTLLRSLQLSGEITERIRERYQKTP
jgi:hypothetical protein